MSSSLDRYLDAPGEVHAASRAMVIGVVAAVVVLGAAGVALGIAAIKLLLAWIG
jgi:hypothetical protein